MRCFQLLNCSGSCMLTVLRTPCHSCAAMHQAQSLAMLINAMLQGNTAVLLLAWPPATRSCRSIPGPLPTAKHCFTSTYRGGLVATTYLLAHANHHSRVPRPAHNAGEHRPGSIVSSKSGLRTQHWRSVSATTAPRPARQHHWVRPQASGCSPSPCRSHCRRQER